MRRLLLTAALVVACGDDDGTIDPDAGTPDAATDSMTGGDALTDAPTDSLAGSEVCTNDTDDDGDGDIDCYDTDCVGNTGCDFSCGDFPAVPEWSPEDVGLRAVIVAEGLGEPVALSFGYDDLLYVVSQGEMPSENAVRTIDIETGDAQVFSNGSAWPTPADLLTTIIFDADARFGTQALFVSDKGTDGDGDSILWRLESDRSVTMILRGPGAGLDDIYGLAFSPLGSTYPEGLYITGDTDSGARSDHWGVYTSAGDGTPFSSVAGVQGIAFDVDEIVGGGLIACRPNGGGFSGDDTISRISETGDVVAPIAAGLPGIHAIKIATGRGSFDAGIYAASWQTGELFHVEADGTVNSFAAGLTLTEFSGDMLAFSPDEHGLFLADRATGRVICVEPVE